MLSDVLAAIIADRSIADSTHIKNARGRLRRHGRDYVRCEALHVTVNGCRRACRIRSEVVRRVLYSQAVGEGLRRSSTGRDPRARMAMDPRDPVPGRGLAE